jgi:hypothetical protein
LRKTSVSLGCFLFLSIGSEEHALRMSPAQRSWLFREVNDRIYELLATSEPDLPGEFLCECGSECDHRVLLSPAVFASLRRAGRGIQSPDCIEPTFELGSVPALS